MHQSTATLSSSDHRIQHGHWVLLMAAACQFAALVLGRAAFSLVAPAMRTGLDLAYTQVGALASASLTGYVVVLTALNTLTARWGYAGWWPAACW
jgi:sugar phosphate permease